MMKFFRAPLLIILSLAALAAAAGPSFPSVSREEQDRLFDKMLLEIEVAAKTAGAEIEKLPSLVDDERSRIKNSLDKWASQQLPKILETNYLEVEKALAESSLPKEEGAFSVWWKQTKAGAGSREDLKLLVELFFKDLQPRLSAAGESFQKAIIASLEEEAGIQLAESMERVRRPFIGILKQRLPVYNTIPIPNTDRAALSFSSADKRGGLSEGSIPLKGLVGVALVLLGRKIMARIMKFMVMKIAGKVLAKIVPIIGWILLAFEVYDLAGARDQLEEEMRKSFLEEYKAEINAESVWWKGDDGGGLSMREEIDRNIGSLLKSWERICRSEADSMIQSAQILSFSDEVRNYVSKQLEEGAEFEPVLQKMSIMWDVFGKLLAQGQVQVFESMLVAAPDRNDLRLLARGLGPRLLPFYDKFGADYLRAVSRIGVYNYLSSEEWTSGVIDWHILNASLVSMPDLTDNREAASGLLALVLEGAQVKGVSPEALAAIGAKRDLFSKIWKILKPDAGKTAALLENKKAAANVGEGIELYPESAAVFLKNYNPEFWSAWSRDDVIDLMRITEFRAASSGKPRDSVLVPPEDRGELISLYRQGGRQAVSLWDTYATEDSGMLGKNLARRSIACLVDGYDYEELKDKERLEFAVMCRKIPVIGKFFYDNFKNLGFLPRLLVVAAGLFSVVALIFFFFRRKK